MRLLTLAALLIPLAVNLPAARSAEDIIRVEFWDEPEDRPPLVAALQALYRQCPLLVDAAPMIDKVLITWQFSLDSWLPFAQFGWHDYASVSFYVRDRRDFFELYGPRSMSVSWAQDRVDYITGGGPHPGIVPRDLLAFRLCGQPINYDHLVPSPDMAVLTAPPSAALPAPKSR